MDEEIKTEVSALRRSSQFICKINEDYVADYQKIYTTIENLRIECKGQSSNQFDILIKNYLKDFQELEKVLERYVRFLKVTIEDIENHDANLKT